MSATVCLTTFILTFSLIFEHKKQVELSFPNARHHVKYLYQLVSQALLVLLQLVGRCRQSLS